MMVQCAGAVCRCSGAALWYSQGTAPHPLLPIPTGLPRTERLQGEYRWVKDVNAIHGPALATSGLCLTSLCLPASQGEKGKRGIDGVDGMKVIMRPEG